MAVFSFCPISQKLRSLLLHWKTLINQEKKHSTIMGDTHDVQFEGVGVGKTKLRCYWK